MLSQFITQPVMIILAALVGLFLGTFPLLQSVPLYVVEIFLMLLLYIVFLSIDLRTLFKASGQSAYIYTALGINFIITPCLAYILGLLFLSDSLPLRIGLTMLLVTPCTDWYLVFTKLGKGNVELNMAILPLQLGLQVLLLPVYLFLFFSSVVPVLWSSLLANMAFVLLLPFTLALCTKAFLAKKTALQNLVTTYSEQAQLVFLCLAVCIMFASQGQQVIENKALFIQLFLPLLCFFCSIYWVTALVAKILRFTTANSVALHFTTLARNSPLALAIAVTAFPEQPLIALALIIGPLLELPVLSLVAHILRRKQPS